MLERTSDRWVSIALSVVLHGSLVAVLVYGFWTYHKSQPPTPTLAIEGTVVDSRSLSEAAVKTPPAPQPPAPEPAPAPAPAPEPIHYRGDRKLRRIDLVHVHAGLEIDSLKRGRIG